MKRRKSINDFINQNYTPVHDVPGEYAFKPRVTIYKANVMKDLPPVLIDYLVDLYWKRSYYAGRYYTGGNCDYGFFDAFYMKKYYHKNDYVVHVKIYVTSILRRPFTQEQKRYYTKNGLIQPPRRIYKIYDSANDNGGSMAPPKEQPASPIVINH